VAGLNGQGNLSWLGELPLRGRSCAGKRDLLQTEQLSSALPSTAPRAFRRKVGGMTRLTDLHGSPRSYACYTPESPRTTPSCDS